MSYKTGGLFTMLHLFLYYCFGPRLLRAAEIDIKLVKHGSNGNPLLCELFVVLRTRVDNEDEPYRAEHTLGPIR